MKVIPTTFIQALSQRKIKLHISADIKWKSEFSSANYSEIFDLSDIASSAGFDCWDEFLNKSSFEDIEEIMNRSFHKSANEDFNYCSKKTSSPLKGYVYLMVNNRNGYTKIGFSKEPLHREKTLQSEEPEIEMVFKTEATMDDEKRLHDEYSEKRLRGEWFNLDHSDKKRIMNGEWWKK